MLQFKNPPFGKFFFKSKDERKHSFHNIYKVRKGEQWSEKTNETNIKTDR